MKKSVVAFCGALITAVALAEGPAPEAAQPEGPRPEMRQRNFPGPRPLSLRLDANTSDEEIAKFKAEVAAKIDETVAAAKAKPAEEAKPVSIVLFVNDRAGRPGMGRGPRGGEMGRRPQGGRPEGRGMRGPGRHRRNAEKGEMPPPPPPAEESAPEAPAE